VLDRHGNDGAGLADLRDEVRALREELAAMREERRAAAAELRTHLEHVHGHLLSAVQVLIDEEAVSRRRLDAARAGADYDAPFTERDPLVSIVIPTYTNVEGLRTRSVPSALGQTHAHVEVIVVGDAAPPETAEAVASFGDARVRYENLNRRGPYPEERDALWFTAGTQPLNRGIGLARGSWFAVLNDDDEFRPEFVSSLLELARERRAEVAYGKLLYHEPDKPSWELGTFPPATHQFGWQMALQHRALKLYEYELATQLFHEPGDWNRARRMLRTGVRFEFLDAVVGDYWPSRLWEGRA
jgi:hypothetical protein